MNRNLPIDDVREIATGYIFFGNKGLDLGLIDELGGKEEAIVYLEKILNSSVEIVF